jgi:outer membrane protein OmpA-like peptidoglycan-associated protein
MSLHRPLLLGSSFVMLLMGCTHTAPAELVDARDAYERAADGPAKKYTPAELHIAHTALRLAEQSFSDDEPSLLVRNQAYIAMRKTEIAESLARTEMHERGLSASITREEVLEDEDAERTKAELANTEASLDDTERALDDETAAGARTASELEAEKKLRADAEKRAAQANADLARIAAIKQDDRGTIITLSGSVLFASGKYVLLAGAQAKLTQVAEALLAGDPASTFVVEGHTDSQGKSEDNKALSLNRANAVRDYLVQHDIAADRITAQGHGEDHTVADNDNAEGRANNRRVEIVVKPGKGG